MKRLVTTMAIFLSLSGSAFSQVTPFVGQIMTFAGTFCPTGWLATNGALLPINQNVALFSILGVNYGGDARTTFGLPNMQPIYTKDRFPLTTCIAIQGVFPSRN